MIICLKYRLGKLQLNQVILLKFTFCSDFTEFSPKYTLVLFDFFYNILTSISEFKSSSSKSGKTLFKRPHNPNHTKRRSTAFTKNWEKGFLCSGDAVKHLTVFGNKLIARHPITHLLNDNARRKCLQMTPPVLNQQPQMH